MVQGTTPYPTDLFDISRYMIIVMWEEPLNHVKVLHRRLPDAPDKDGEGMEYRSDRDDDEWEVVETPDHGNIKSIYMIL